MFKIKKAAAFLKAAAILSIAALTGCQATIENLLTAPKLTQEQSEIYQALINSSGSSIKLKYPRGGEYRSAFVLQDIDSDGTQEALVFYESQSVQSGESALPVETDDEDETLADDGLMDDQLNIPGEEDDEDMEDFSVDDLGDMDLDDPLE